MPDAPLELEKTPLSEHLRELRSRLMISLGFVLLGFTLAYSFKEDVFQFLTAPLSTTYGRPQLIFTAVHELFFTYIKLSFLCGVFVGMPVILNQIWRFVSPGLYIEEKRLIRPFLVFAPILFYSGGLFAYFIVMPLAVDFFFGFATVDITPLPSVKEYLTFFIKLSFGFGLAFELPVFLVLLSLTGIVDAVKLRWFRRYAWVVLFIVAALLTPPDPLSQILLALPMVFLYEVAIFLVHIVNKKRPRTEVKS